MPPPAEPIRFRCFHCGALLGVVRSKAGSVVSCPRCGLGLIVPPPAGAADPPTTFELEVSGGPSPLESTPSPAPAIDPPPAPAPDQPMPAADPAGAALPFRVEPIPLHAEIPSLLADRRAPRSRDLVTLPRAAILAWSLFASLALAMAFVAGMMVGHYLWTKP
ncbi:MAG TPA: hypothetical protein VG406_09660 [Isosphaeraceae bacterium]|jgi:DNA-directed RNA polymerase subunit RPC12/RpoP|nr:hypothetical protein [Isosphaeraceae bacterium]